MISTRLCATFKIRWKCEINKVDEQNTNKSGILMTISGLPRPDIQQSRKVDIREEFKELFVFVE